MRIGETGHSRLYYLHTDHLGSVVLATYGQVVSMNLRLYLPLILRGSARTAAAEREAKVPLSAPRPALSPLALTLASPLAPPERKPPAVETKAAEAEALPAPLSSPLPPPPPEPGEPVPGSEARYLPYGEVRIPGEPVALTERAFTGQRLDRATGLMDYRARWYDPRLGRFIQADTIVPGAGDPQALNRYSYVLNNPLRYNDPSGHCPWCITIGVGAIIGAGLSYGVQAAVNISQNGLSVQAFTDVNWAQVGAGAVAGAVGGATFGLGTAVLGTGLAGTVGAGAISGATAGQAAVATENVLSGHEVTEGLGNPAQMATDAVLGGVLAGVGYAARRGTISILAKTFTHNPDSEYVILGGYPNYRNFGEEAGFTYFEMSPRMWSVTNRLGLAEDINIRFMEQQAGQGKTFLVTLSYNRVEGTLAWGAGTERELSWLAARSDYVNTGGRYLWRYKGGIIE